MDLMRKRLLCASLIAMCAMSEKPVISRSLDIDKLRQRRVAVATECENILKRSSKDGTALTTEEKEKFTALEKENTDLKETIERAERLTATKAELGKFQTLTDPTRVDMSDKDKQRYSVVRAIRCVFNKQPLDGLEGEISAEIARKSGVDPKGFYVPMGSLDWESRNRRQVKRAFDTSAGSKVITQEWRGYIEALRNASVISQVGAVFLEDLVGLVDIPKKSATTTAYWVTEGSDITGSAPTMSTQLQLSPKTVGAYTDVTRSLIKQSSYDIEMLVRNDLLTTIALGIDDASINGSGSSGQPTGVIATSGIGSIALGTDGAALAWADIVNFETTVANANAGGPNSSLAYLTNAKVRGKLKVTPKIGSTFPDYIFEKDGTVNGYDVGISNAVVNNGTKGSGTNLSTLIFGDWNDLVVGLWGAVDLTVDPYSLSKSGGIRLVTLQNADIQLRRTASFVKCTDVVTA